MKQRTVRNSGLIIPLCAGLVLAGCAKTAAMDSAATDIKQIDAQDAAIKPEISHAKTGAAVTLASEQAFAVAPGSVGEVVIEVSETYRNGTLTVEARSTDSVDVFGAARNQRFDLATNETHSWTLQFSAQSDGVFYIPVVATAAPEDSLAMSRAFSVRVEVGDTSLAKEKSPQAGVVESLSDGEKIVTMQAEESIK